MSSWGLAGGLLAAGLLAWRGPAAQPPGLGGRVAGLRLQHFGQL